MEAVATLRGQACNAEARGPPGFRASVEVSWGLGFVGFACFCFRSAFLLHAAVWVEGGWSSKACGGFSVYVDVSSFEVSRV